MLNKHVATSTAKSGGVCGGCEMSIGVNNPIYKYSTLGETTSGGNGPGVWRCQWCHDLAQTQPIEDDSEVKAWECDGCSRMANPVVMLDGKRFCFPCWQNIRVDQGHLP